MKKYPCRCPHDVGFSCLSAQKKHTAIPEERVYYLAKKINEKKIVSCGFYMASIEFDNAIDEKKIQSIDCSFCERKWFSEDWGMTYLSYINKKMEHPFFDLDYFPCGSSCGDCKRKELSLDKKIKIFKFLCTCDYFFISAGSSSSREFMILPDELLDDFAVRLNKNKLTGGVFLDEVYRFGRKMVICPKCGRHWVYSDDLKNYISYEKEDPVLRIM